MAGTPCQRRERERGRAGELNDSGEEKGREGGREEYVPDDAASSFCMFPAGDTAGVVCIVRLEGGGEGRR